MRLQDIRKPKGANKPRKRLGRGSGSGHGKTSGKGHKGVMARSGATRRLGFEGGQMSLIRRTPKRGFTSFDKKYYQIVNVSNLKQFKKDSSVDKDALKRAGLIKKVSRPVKILGDGEIGKPLIVTADAFSARAKKKIEDAGGKTGTAKQAQNSEK